MTLLIKKEFYEYSRDFKPGWIVSECKSISIDPLSWTEIHVINLILDRKGNLNHSL